MIFFTRNRIDITARLGDEIGRHVLDRRFE